MGEKILAWSDKDPSLDEILTHVTLWWLTETFAPSIYPYRHVSGSGIESLSENLSHTTPSAQLDLVKASDPKWVRSIKLRAPDSKDLKLTSPDPVHHSAYWVFQLRRRGHSSSPLLGGVHL